MLTPKRAAASAGAGRGRAREGEGAVLTEIEVSSYLWERSQRITLYGASCYIVEDIQGGVWILAPLAKVAPRKSYEAEDVPNTRTRI